MSKSLEGSFAGYEGFLDCCKMVVGNGGLRVGEEVFVGHFTRL